MPDHVFARLTHRQLLSAVLLGACGLLAASPSQQVLAQPASLLARVDWGSLSPDQQAALQPLATRWASMSPDDQRKWLDISSNYKHLSPAEQELMQERMLDWAGMSKAKRMQTRTNFDKARKNLSADERKAKWDEFRKLDEDEREALAGKSKPAVRGAAPATQPQRPLRVRQPEATPSH